jgi:hypothetical protein
MPMTVNSGQTTVSGNVTTTISNVEVACTVLCTVKTNTGDTTCGTVPANKVWRIRYASISASSTSGINILKFNGTTVLGNTNGGAGTVSTFSELQLHGGYIELTAGQTIVANCSVSPQAYFVVVYNEVSV